MDMPLNPAPIISIRNLSKHYRVLNRREGLRGAIKDLFSRDFRTVKAVDDINFSVRPGEIVGFLGPNGAGKSTTIKMMTGVLQPTSGELEIDGYVPFAQRKAYVANIGVVMGQRSQLWWDLPVIESFKILREIYGVSRESYEENMGIFRKLIDFEPLLLKATRHLSLGQRMLCDIIASFLHNPRLIFLDEPSIGLDVTIKAQVREIIRTLNELKGTTIILTSHDVGDVEALCQRIVLIDKGRIVYDGDTTRFNHIYGAYRTLAVQLEQVTPGILAKVQEELTISFPESCPIRLGEAEQPWLEFHFNQDQVPLLDVVRFAMETLEVKDFRVREVPMEQVIRRAYQGKEIEA